MKIIGVGCGPGMMTEAAVKAVRSGTLIVGSERALDIAREYIPDDADVRIIEDYKTLKYLPDYAILLSTGDPMVSGLGFLGGDIIPGISSIQYGAAKTGISLTGIYICSAHGRDYEKTIFDCIDILKKTHKVVIITDPTFPVSKLGEKLANQIPSARIILCENLGYPGERILEFSVGKTPELIAKNFILFIIS